MKAYLCQVVNRLDEWTPGEQTYAVIAVLVADGPAIVAVPVGAGTSILAAQLQRDLAGNLAAPAEFFARRFEANGTRTSYALPVKVAAETPEKAAHKLYARLIRGGIKTPSR